MKPIILTDTLLRWERRLLKQIKSPKLYTSIAWLVFILFGFKKKFLVARKNKQTKKKAIASVTTDSIFGTKISYIDDFIVDRWLRWKGEGQKLFGTALEYIWKKQDSEYAVLVTSEQRKSSLHLYKKFGFSILSLGVGYLAYKKMKK